MKKLFILLTACMMGFAFNSSAMTCEISHEATGLQTATDLQGVMSEIDDLIEVLKSDAGKLSSEDIDRWTTRIFTDIENLSSQDSLCALAYYAVSINELDSSLGFSMDRLEELMDFASSWLKRLAESDDVDVELRALGRALDVLNDTEQMFVRRTISVLLVENL